MVKHIVISIDPHSRHLLRIKIPDSQQPSGNRYVFGCYFDNYPKTIHNHIRWQLLFSSNSLYSKGSIDWYAPQRRRLFRVHCPSPIIYHTAHYLSRAKHPNRSYCLKFNSTVFPLRSAFLDRDSSLAFIISSSGTSLR